MRTYIYLSRWIVKQVSLHFLSIREGVRKDSSICYGACQKKKKERGID